MTSAVVGGKTLTRRTEGGQVIYDGFIDTDTGGAGGGGGGGIQAKVRIPRTTVNSWEAPQSFDSSFNVSKVTGLSGYYTVYFINAVVDPVFAWSLSEGLKTVVIKSIASDGMSFNFEIHNTPGNPAGIGQHVQPAYIIVT